MYLYPREVGVISPLLSLSITHQMHGSKQKALPLNNRAPPIERRSEPVYSNSNA